MKPTSARYTIFLLMFLIALINYIDRGALSFSANAIASEYHLNKTQLGAVLGYFGIGYLLGSLCGGFLADRFGTRKVWLWAGLCWSVLEIVLPGRGRRGWRCLAVPR